MKPLSIKKMIVLIFSLVIGVACIWFSFGLTKMYFQVKGWARADATVISKKLDYKEVPNGYNYTLKVEYKYVFDSKEYVNDKISLVELTGGSFKYRIKRQADKAVDNIGANMKIYVNPEMPSQSVLFCDGIVWYLFALIVGIILLLYCLVTFINML